MVGGLLLRKDVISCVTVQYMHSRQTVHWLEGKQQLPSTSVNSLNKFQSSLEIFLLHNQTRKPSQVIIAPQHKPLPVASPLRRVSLVDIFGPTSNPSISWRTLAVPMTIDCSRTLTTMTDFRPPIDHTRQRRQLSHSRSFKPKARTTRGKASPSSNSNNKSNNSNNSSSKMAIHLPKDTL